MTMLERVARALCVAVYGDVDLDNRRGRENWEHSLALARAALDEIADKRAIAEVVALALEPARDLRINPLYWGDPAWTVAEGLLGYLQNGRTSPTNEPLAKGVL